MIARTEIIDGKGYVFINTELPHKINDCGEVYVEMDIPRFEDFLERGQHQLMGFWDAEMPFEHMRERLQRDVDADLGADTYKAEKEV